MISSRAICGLVAKTTSGGTPAARQRAGSLVHFSGRYNRAATGMDASPSVTATWTLTWQLADLPSAPQYWCATPTECSPCLSQPVSSTIQADSGSKCAGNSRRITCHTASASHGLSVTNCCSFWESTPKRSAIGSIDLRSPGSSNPSIYSAAPSLRSLRPIGSAKGARKRGNSSACFRQCFAVHSIARNPWARRGTMSSFT